MHSNFLLSFPLNPPPPINIIIYLFPQAPLIPLTSFTIPHIFPYMLCAKINHYSPHYHYTNCTTPFKIILLTSTLGSQAVGSHPLAGHHRDNALLDNATQSVVRVPSSAGTRIFSRKERNNSKGPACFACRSLAHWIKKLPVTHIR